MSQHFDICKTVVSQGIKQGLPQNSIIENVNAVLDAVEYDDSYLIDSQGFKNMVSYMLTQKDGLYGVSHLTLKLYL